MTRLFVALKIPDEIKKRIIKLRNEVLPEWGNYKWEKEEKIHLTLKFIGEVDYEQVETISESLEFIGNHSKISCRFTHFGFFFKGGIAKILWVGLFTDPPVFNLVDQINNSLEEFSVPPEKRKFRSHITLLRIKKKEPEKFISIFKEYKIPDINFTADEVVLYKSELLPDSSKYSEIKTYKLK